MLVHLLGGALLVVTAEGPSSEPAFDGVLGAGTERPTVYSASLGGTRELPTRHRGTPTAKCQEWPYHKLPELSDFDAHVGSKDYKKLCRKVRGFFSSRRRTRAQIRATNEKAYAKKGPRVRPRPK